MINFLTADPASSIPLENGRPSCLNILTPPNDGHPEWTNINYPKNQKSVQNNSAQPEMLFSNSDQPCSFEHLKNFPEKFRGKKVSLIH